MNLAFHIGFHKTATSWFQQDYFQAHPQLKVVADYENPWDDPLVSYLVSPSDFKFDARECRKHLKQIIANYNVTDNMDKVAVISAERLCGHPYSGGYDSMRIAKRIHACAPEAKVMIVIRNQVDMIASLYAKLLRQGYRGTIKNLLTDKHWKTTGFNLEYYEYDNLIALYLKLFPLENIIVLTYEEVNKSKQNVIREVCKFLSVSYLDPDPYDRRVNRSLPGCSVRAVRFLNHFNKTELNPHPLFTLSPSFRRFIISTLSRLSGRRYAMDAESCEMVRKYYRKSNDRLRILLGKELPDYP